MANEIAQNILQWGEIILYQPDETVRLEVRLEDDTVWLTQAQMAELFQTTKNNITLHIGNVYKEKELSMTSTSKESLLVQVEGNRQVTRKRNLYNLDVIISVGYRVKSLRGTKFRQWASLKDLGKKWFAFTLINDITATELISRISGGTTVNIGN